MKVGDQVIDLPIIEQISESWHVFTTVLEHLSYTIVVCRNTAGKILMLHDAGQARSMERLGRVGLVAGGTAGDEQFLPVKFAGRKFALEFSRRLWLLAPYKKICSREETEQQQFFRWGSQTNIISNAGETVNSHLSQFERSVMIELPAIDETAP